MSTDSPASSKRLARVRGLVTATLFLTSPAHAQSTDSSISDNSLRLPTPTGIYAVGSRLMHLVDTTRPDTLSQDPERYREILAQLWYPIDVPAAAEVIPYLPDEGLIEAMIDQEYLFQPAELLHSWAGIRMRTAVDRPVAEGRRPFPLLFISHGLGVSRTQYASLAQELTSHGNVVVTIDHPYGGLSVLPDGRILSTAGRTDLEDPDGIEAEAKRWARDASFVLDRLLTGRDSVAGVPVSARLDSGRVVMLGHSLGGAAAWQACREDPRFRACAGLDGTAVGEFMTEGFGAPTLVLQSAPEYSDADLAAAGRTRETWDAAGRMFDSAWATALQRSDSPVHRIWLRGFGHSGYGDAPWVMPNAITRFGGRIVGAQRGFELVSTYVRAFFDRYRSDYPTPLLDGPNPLWPEVAFAVPY